MNSIRLPRTRLAVAFWASLGLLGIVVAMHSVVGMAASTGVLPWVQAGDPVSRLMLRFIAGVALGAFAMWGIYKQTIHHKADEYSA